MSIASEITRLQGVKSDILSAIADKGVTVPTGSMLADCPELIAAISGGGGSPRWDEDFGVVYRTDYTNLIDGIDTPEVGTPKSMPNDRTSFGLIDGVQKYGVRLNKSNNILNYSLTDGKDASVEFKFIGKMSSSYSYVKQRFNGGEFYPGVEVGQFANLNVVSVSNPLLTFYADYSTATPNARYTFPLMTSNNKLNKIRYEIDFTIGKLRVFVNDFLLVASTINSNITSFGFWQEGVCDGVVTDFCIRERVTA